ncbi:hypothetical protein H6F88_30720 [Oculatella sp. FACHB-28]|uniref:hypothetical protein n=1 Tax=Oculatella sp. FACHB-28 TaxID=2692845 RepID=UPI001684466E|nr:hypothetical protein [Oculatella sp. FACHB-28]MBD2060318.1 hypothetical protein [Oculatella sp. FACHB-28]
MNQEREVAEQLCMGSSEMAILHPVVKVKLIADLIQQFKVNVTLSSPTPANLNQEMLPSTKEREDGE